MSIARQVMRGLRNLLHRNRADKDIAEEVDHFFAEAKAEFEARGLPAHEASRSARLALGSSTAAREEVRSYGWETFVDGIFQDLRYTVRRLRATPGFTLVSIVTLALGLGATSAIFSLINGVLLKPLPYTHPEQLVSVWMTAPGVKITDLNMSPSVYFTMHDEQRAFQAVSMFNTGSTFIIGKTHPEQVQSISATHELLSILGITPQLGRPFVSEDDNPDGEGAVIISDGYWRSHFGGDRAVLGRRINIEGKQASIVGILPPSFEFLDHKPDLLLPLRIKRSGLHLLGFGNLAVGRLKPGVTIKQASADFAHVLFMVPKQFSPPPGFSLKMYDEARIGPNLRPLKKDLVGDIGNTLWLLMATVVIVLLIACSNVANLLLVRTDARQQELAVRAALGAAATRVARELLFESVLLGVIAGAAGLALCQVSLKLLSASDLVHLPRSGNIKVDGWVVLFTFAVSIAFSALFGLIPVLRYVRPRLAEALRSGGRSMSHSKNRQQVRSFLVVLQVALALVLLVTAGLMIRTFRNLHNVDPGFTNPHQLQTIKVAIPQEEVKEPARVIRMEQAMLDKMKTVNGVVSASITTSVPMGGGVSSDPPVTSPRGKRLGSIRSKRYGQSKTPLVVEHTFRPIPSARCFMMKPSAEFGG